MGLGVGRGQAGQSQQPRLTPGHGMLLHAKGKKGWGWGVVPVPEKGL